MSSEVQQKIWGKTWPLVENDKCIIMMLEVEAGSWCSIHRHESRMNHFINISAGLHVITYGADDVPNEKEKHTDPVPCGSICCVSTHVWHRFEVKKSGQVVEIYTPDLIDNTINIDDIERWDVGGRLEQFS